MNRIVRKVKIDAKAIARQSGMRCGTICYSLVFGWVVQNTSGNPNWPNMAAITPPKMRDGETMITIKDDCWCFHGNVIAAKEAAK